MNIQEREEMEFYHSSDAEIDTNDAHLIGSRNTDQCWILSGRDVWYRNPYFKGPTAPHPEDNYTDDDGDFQFILPAYTGETFNPDTSNPDIPF